MKDTEDELELVIVRDMWLTDFDVPSLHTMYIDKPMKGHTLMQAIADNDSARELMQKEKLRELAVVLFEKVKQNASIDWTIKESVGAKLKVIVKRTLRQYGYPPDMLALATETVLKQAELIADELTQRK
jgi:type I site-specific restriction-modification system R (restriction) subunit